MLSLLQNTTQYPPPPTRSNAVTRDMQGNIFDVVQRRGETAAQPASE